MINLEYTCIKKGNYTVATEEKPEPTPIVYPEIDSPDYEPDFDHEPSEIDYPDYDMDYGLFSAEPDIESSFDPFEDDDFDPYFDLREAMDREISKDKDSSYFNNSVDSEIDTQSHNHDIAQPVSIVEDQQLTSNSVEFQITQNINDNFESEIDEEQYWKEFAEEADRQYKKLSCPNCESFYPYVLEGKCECGYEKFDFESIVDEVKKDIASQKFLEKSQYYMDLLKVDRAEFDDYLIYEFDVEELIDTDDEELLYDMEVKVNEVKVFDRLFSLYCPDTGFVIPAQHNQHLREYLERLELDGRMIVRNQLNLFGEV